MYMKKLIFMLTLGIFSNQLCGMFTMDEEEPPCIEKQTIDPKEDVKLHIQDCRDLFISMHMKQASTRTLPTTINSIKKTVKYFKRHAPSSNSF